MSKKSLGQKIKIAFFIYLNGGNPPGTADIWSKIKMGIYLLVMVSIPVASVTKGIYTQSFAEGFKVFFGLTILWLALVVAIKNGSRVMD